MTDRDLVKKAAKAAGWPVRWAKDLGCYVHDVDYSYSPRAHFSPLTDNGHAFELAVKVGIQIGDYHQYGRALAYHGATRGSGEFWELGEPLAATRRAIVRAAAAMADK